jgi:hypothetical protein
MEVTTLAEPTAMHESGEGSNRQPGYIQAVRKLLVALAIAALLGLLFIVGGTTQNHGCLPWKEAIHIGGSTFSEGDRGHYVCK